MMKKIFVCFLVMGGLILPACNVSQKNAPSLNTPTPMFTEIQPSATLTEIPPPATLAPTETSAPSAGTVALDFAALLCGAQWMNGGQNLEACPPVNANHEGGFAITLDSAPEGLPANLPVLLTIPAWNGFNSFFLRYPSFKVRAGDRFRTLLRCKINTVCAVQFALEYYDADGKYHSSFMAWDFKTGDADINVDADLSSLAGQTIDFVLAIRPNNNTPEQDSGLWVAPQIFRTNP